LVVARIRRRGPLAHANFDMSRKRILQIFNRYLEYGGEEGSVYRIGDALQQLYDVEYLLGSSQELVSQGLAGKAAAVAKVFHNQTMVRRLQQYQKIGRFDFWQIHNVLPAMSPSVYSTGFNLGIPIVQYLHNYRMSCVNGFFLNHGEPCQVCMNGNFLPAALTKCWHESHVQSGIMGLVLRRLRHMDVFNQVTRWIAISHAQKELHVRMGIPEERIDVIHHFLEPGDEVSGWEGGDGLFLGRLSAEKGVSCLLRAWKAMRGRKGELFVVGDGPERENLEQQAREENLERVFFTGFLKAWDQKKIWRKASFLAVPSIWVEPFGMVILEAWSKGIPVIAHNIGAFPELIDHGVNGYLVKTGDAGAMAEAMQELLENPGKAREMGLRGREKLKDQFNKKLWLTKMEKMYAKLGIKS